MKGFRELQKREQATVLIVGGVGVLAIVFSVAALGTKLRAPFDFGVRGKFVSQEEKDAQAKVALKTKDTDGDGVSDYDELYIYRTSPYLADSDSDGIPDGVEIKNFTDPNCPQGKTCREVVTTSNDNTNLSALPQDTTAGSATNSAAAPVGADFPTLLLNMFGDISKMTQAQFADKVKTAPIADLRNLLIQAGLPADSVGKLKDGDVRDALVQIFVITTDQTKNQTNSSPTNSNSNASVNSNTNSVPTSAKK